MKKNHTFILLVLALFLCGFAMGCSSLTHDSYKRDFINQQVSNYAYHTDLGNLMSAARSMLFSYGYQAHGPMSDTQLETGWGRTSNYSNTYRRYLVTGYKNNDGTSSIHFDYYEETRNDGHSSYATSGRDYSMEYELLRRVDSQGWNDIEHSAEAYANQIMASENK